MSRLSDEYEEEYEYSDDDLDDLDDLDQVNECDEEYDSLTNCEYDEDLKWDREEMAVYFGTDDEKDEFERETAREEFRKARDAGRQMAARAHLMHRAQGKHVINIHRKSDKDLLQDL